MQRLIDMANEAGGPDNITVIAARFEGEGLTAVASGDEVGHRTFPLADSGQTPAFEESIARATRSHAHRAVRAMSRPTMPISEGDGDRAPLATPVRQGTGRAIAKMVLLDADPRHRLVGVACRTRGAAPPASHQFVG